MNQPNEQRVGEAVERLKNSPSLHRGNQYSRDLQTLLEAYGEVVKDKERLDWIDDSQDGCNEWEMIEKLWREGSTIRDAIDKSREGER